MSPRFQADACPERTASISLTGCEWTIENVNARMESTYMCLIVVLSLIFFLASRFIFVHFPFLHHKLHMFENGDVFQRIAFCRNHIGKRARRNFTDLSV